MEKERVVAIRHLSKSFGKKQIFQDLDLNITAGSILGIVAPNGYGKSTLFQLMLNFIQEDGGSVTFFEKYSFKKTADYQLLREQVVLLPNQFELDDTLTGWQHLQLYRRMWERETTALKDIVAELGMTDYVNNKVGSYSLGMRQRLCFAMMYLTDAKIMMMDELTNGLDVETVAMLSKVLLGLREAGKTLLMISHDLDHLQQVADEVLFLKDHQIGYRYPQAGDREELYYRLAVADLPQATSFPAVAGMPRLFLPSEKLATFLQEKQLPYEVTPKKLWDIFHQLYGVSL